MKLFAPHGVRIMNRSTKGVSVSGIVLAATVLATDIAANAGSLTPPAGPIAPTMKNLSDVEPRTAIRNDYVSIVPIVISSPGSYYLAEDIYAIHSQHGIEITTSNVTLDLMGFTLYGNVEVGSLIGVQVTGNQKNITIQNGVVRDFFGDGINLFNAVNFKVKDILTSNNGSEGIHAGYGGVIDHCTATSNGGMGILTAGYVTVSHSSASNNGSNGIDVFQGSVVSDCSASSNDGAGIDATLGTIVNCGSFQNDLDGITATGSTITGCSATNNLNDGIEVDSGSHVYGNNVRANGAAGIHATGNSNRIDSNNATSNARGFDVDVNNNLIVRNSARSSSVSNYDIVAGNDVGPIGTAAAAVSPWANISN